MADQPENASEYAPLLADLDLSVRGMLTLDWSDAKEAAKAIRALEAKVEEKEATIFRQSETITRMLLEHDDLRADRDRLEFRIGELLDRILALDDALVQIELTLLNGKQPDMAEVRAAIDAARGARG